ncbi:hypothetical protein AOLI_G00201130 [Acnodon oligacanthus]
MALSVGTCPSQQQPLGWQPDNPNYMRCSKLGGGFAESKGNNPQLPESLGIDEGDLGPGLNLPVPPGLVLGRHPKQTKNAEPANLSKQSS